jgi:hypothetical protein
MLNNKINIPYYTTLISMINDIAFLATSDAHGEAPQVWELLYLQTPELQIQFMARVYSSHFHELNLWHFDLG